MRTVIVNIIFSFLLANSIFAQSQNYHCPWNEIDCQGKCGRFTDSRGDGFCDYGQLSSALKKDSVLENDSIVKNTTISDKNTNSINKPSVQETERRENANNIDKNDLNKPEKNKIKPVKARSYNLLLISSLCIILYFFTWLMFRFKVIRKYIHRKIWNILLLLTFLISAIIGIILVVLINYSINSIFVRDYLYWHVQFGIAMTVISIIHIIWHWKYFFNIISKRKNI